MAKMQHWKHILSQAPLQHQPRVQSANSIMLHSVLKRACAFFGCVSNRVSIGKISLDNMHYKVSETQVPNHRMCLSAALHVDPLFL